MSGDPRLQRFAVFDDHESIRLGCEHIPPPLSGLDKVSPTVAMERTRKVLRCLLVITPKTAALLQKLGDHLRAGADVRYGDAEQYRRLCYEKEPELPSVPMLNLVGLAGIGKSKLIKALEKLLPDLAPTTFDDKHDDVPVRGAIRTTILQGDSDLRFLGRIGQKVDVTQADDFEDLLLKVGKIAYRDGVAGIGIDEFQHGSLSAANARITSLLLTARDTTIPGQCGFNFSLCHRLMKRNQEDRDRLLTNMVLVTPEDPASLGWRQIVLGTAKTFGEYAGFDPVGDAPEIGRLSACLPRNLHRLIVIALGIALEAGKTKVEMVHIRRAYHSRAYASARTDVELLKEDVPSLQRKKRMDLFCPEELLLDSPPDAEKSSEVDTLKKAARAMLEQSMTESERRGRQVLEAGNKPSSGQKVVPLKPRSGISAESLMDAHDGYSKKK